MQPAPSDLDSISGDGTATKIVYHWTDHAAFLVAIATLALLFVPDIIVDSTPLLARPGTDVRFVVGAVGAGLGLWAALRIVSVQHRHRKMPVLVRFATCVMLSLWLGFASAGAVDRAIEQFSFRHGGTLEQVTTLATDASGETRRRGGAIYTAVIVNPIDATSFDLRISRGEYAALPPRPTCVSLLIERAANGAVRLIRPIRWGVRCPWNS